MIKTWTILVLISCQVSMIFGQSIADFENISLPAKGWQNNADPNDYFESGPVRLPNQYFAQFDYWEGWAISNVKDNQTPGFGNQYSAIPGTGAADTDQYAVGYAAAPTTIHLADTGKGLVCDGMYVTNSTYAYYSMRDGDAFAKKFGGETGEDPDFFRVTFRKMKDGVMGTDSVVFYLADYRSSNPTEDYLVDEWVWVDLNVLGEADSLVVALSSSDNGSFGMNTPAYFCIDQVETTTSVSVAPPIHSKSAMVWPNPFKNEIFLSPSVLSREWTLMNNLGERVAQGVLSGGQDQINFQPLASGLYYLQIHEGFQIVTHPLISNP
jgi:hypothetical protein